MKKNTALEWAKSMSITEQEFNKHLAELGYLINGSKNGERTPKGHKHSRRFLQKTYWDVDAMFDVLKLIGKKTGKYFYCDKCGSYNKVEQQDGPILNCICHSCGFPVKLESAKTEEPVKIDKAWWSYIKECVRKEGNISDISYDTWIQPLDYTMIDNRVFIIAPFEAKSISYIIEKYREIFKIVINRETRKHYIVTFVQPGEVLIEDDYRPRRRG